MSCLTRWMVWFSVAGLLVACAGPQIDLNPSARNTAGLYPVEHASTDQVFVALGSDFNQYQMFYIAELDTSDIEVDYSSMTHALQRPEWVLTDEDRHVLQQLYRQAMTTELTKRGYALVDQPSAGVLVIAAQILKLEPVAPKEDLGSREPDERVYSEGPGYITLQMSFHDGGDQQLLATVTDRRQAGIRGMVRENTDMNNRWDIQRLFNGWAGMLASRLDKINGK